MRFGVNRRRVVHETIDGEAILIHMETGFYYSLDGTGSEIWDLVVAGYTTDEIGARLAERYDAPAGQIDEAVLALVDRLKEEGLVDEVDAASNGSAPPRVTFADTGNGRRTEFVEPALHRYTDMADFMLVDPIHEVDDSGWPNAKAVQ
jgi:hypothetical protein